MVTEHEGKTYIELCVQPYNNCCFAAGFVEGAANPADTMYFTLVRGEETVLVDMRPDEMAALAWVINGALWSHTIAEMEARHKQEKREEVQG